jgi:hypothetical protein
MNERWAQGYSDARTTLLASPWLEPMPKEVGVRVFDVMHEILVKNAQPAAESRPTDIGKDFSQVDLKPSVDPITTAVARFSSSPIVSVGRSKCHNYAVGC